MASGQHPRLRVMTFNLKYASQVEEHSWSERRPILKAAMLASDPDLIGTQEGVCWQLQQIGEDLPEYVWVGMGREGGSQGEFMAIFYKRRRFDLLACDHFWLSDTPDVIGSRTWGHMNARMVTWALFRDNELGIELRHWNTHFDHESEVARENSTDLLLDRLRSMAPNRPAIVTGDFNASQVSAVHEKMVARSARRLHLVDAWDRAEVREGRQVATWHGWRGPGESDRRIDWILVSPQFICRRAAVVTYQDGGRYPSDHFPVMCDLELAEDECQADRMRSLSDQGA